MPNDFFTVDQAADYLQCSTSSIRNYIRTGRLAAFRVAGKRTILIPRQTLLDLLEPVKPKEEGK